METIYKGFLIREVFTYRPGMRADFEIFPEDGDQGMIRPNTTLEQIKNEIDEIDELKD